MRRQRRVARLVERCAERCAERRDPERGSAIIEFVFLAIFVMVPLIYLIISVATVQRAQLAVTNAAREAGRAFATADTAVQGQARAQIAADFAFDDAGLHERASLTFVAGSDCGATPVAPSLQPGAVFTVCVRRGTYLPGVPTVVQGRPITSEGRFVIHVDEYRGT